ncbi:hypothetical protein SDC9_102437 [bioreactor metagenome]|uniref:Uncharacterized protein n=1 Tax=bioreactor metagenome TaxID=1076179 RepID=A0A645ARB3_9ZZZZ
MNKRPRTVIPSHDETPTIKAPMLNTSIKTTSVRFLPTRSAIRPIKAGMRIIPTYCAETKNPLSILSREKNSAIVRRTTWNPPISKPIEKCNRHENSIFLSRYFFLFILSLIPVSCIKKSLSVALEGPDRTKLVRWSIVF